MNASGEVTRLALGDFLVAGCEISFMSGHLSDVVRQVDPLASPTTLYLRQFLILAEAVLLREAGTNAPVRKPGAFFLR